MITPKSIHRGRGEGMRKKEKHAQVRRRPSLGDLTPTQAFAPTAALEPMPQNLEEAAKLEESEELERLDALEGPRALAAALAAGDDELDEGEGHAADHVEAEPRLAVVHRNAPPVVLHQLGLGEPPSTEGGAQLRSGKKGEKEK